MTSLSARPSPSDLPLLRWLVGSAVGLAVLTGALALVWGRGPILAVIPWYLPMMHSFVALAALSIAFLAFGRYWVLQEPAPYWLGLGFTSFAVFSVFYVLTWLGIFAGDPNMVGQSLNATSWIWHVTFSVLVAFLLAALFARWPRPTTVGERRWSELVGLAGVLAFVLIGALVVIYELALPQLSVEGLFTPLTTAWNVGLVIAFGVATVLSARRYRRTGDSLFGYVAIAELVLAFAVLTSVIGLGYYDVWWYWQRVLWVLGLSAMLFGLLSEYVQLYRREVERTRELAAMQAEALEERNRLKVLVDTAPVGIIFRSAPDGRVIVHNLAAEILLGRPIQSDLGLVGEVAYYDLRTPGGEPFPPGDLPTACALRGESCLGIELLVRHPSGREVYVLANSAPLRDSKGRVDGAVVALQEITPIKEQEKLRDEFLSAAAHELKTPVTTIKGYAQLLRGWTRAAGDRRETGVVDVINAQCDRLNHRVQELLQVVQLRARETELWRTRFDLGELAAEAVEEARAAAPSHLFALDRVCPVLVAGNRQSVEEVVANLVENAVKYSPPGREVAVRVWAEGDQGILAVRDQGVGIARERQPHVFEPFYEAVPAGSPGYRGVVGLSLYLSKLAVERQGGRIWFESEAGRGSTFYVSLPLVTEDGNHGRSVA